jgi:hypothetical protein
LIYVILILCSLALEKQSEPDEFEVMFEMINTNIQNNSQSFAISEMSLAISKDFEDTTISKIEKEFWEVNSQIPRKLDVLRELNIDIFPSQAYNYCKTDKNFWLCFTKYFPNKSGIISVTKPKFTERTGFFIFSIFDLNGHGRVTKVWVAQKDGMWEIVQSENILET